MNYKLIRLLKRILNMPNALSYDMVKKHINKEDKLISKSYTNNKELLEIKCSKCNIIYKQTYDRYKQGYRHRLCQEKNLNYKKQTKIKPIKCDTCNKKYQPTRNGTRFCKLKCYHKYMKNNEEYKNNCKKYGRKGGMISLTKQKNRSKNEILFSEMCSKFYGKEDIICNEPKFNGYDVDIIVESKKLAIEWNGIWHYKKIHINHHLERIKAKDKYKEILIPRYGYKLYVIKDLGGYDPKFVKEEFEKFIEYVSFKEAYSFSTIFSDY